MRKRQQRTADGSSPVRKSVAYESGVREGVQATVLFCVKNKLSK
jgi:hypothetical protein